MGSLNRSLFLSILSIRSEGLGRKVSLGLLNAEQGQGVSIAWDLVMGRFSRGEALSVFKGSSEKHVLG